MSDVPILWCVLFVFVQPVTTVAGDDSARVGERWTSFETVAAVAVEHVATPAGTFLAAGGHAEVDAAHARTGKQCLRLLGGTGRTVEFVPDYGDQPAAFLSFHAERWTRRAPFEFRVSQLENGKWTEVYDGDATIRIGGFLTAVGIPLKGRPERFRFVCTSPEKSGLLIDDLALVPATPQRVTAATVEDHVVPLLAGAEATPVLRVRLDVVGTLEPIAVTGIDIALDDTAAVKSVRVVADDDSPFTQKADDEGVVRFEGRHGLVHGTNEVRVAVDVRETIDLDDTLTVTCTRLHLSNGTSLVPDHERRLVHRTGVAVRTRGQGGVHTSRIPGLATTRKGTLIAVYDLRHRGGGDLPGDIDVGMSRSTDGGRTWEPTRTILDMGDDPQFRYDGVGDPSILVDRETGTIWVAGVWSHGNRGWHGSGPGLTLAETGQFVLVRSDDDGRTWSKPINVTNRIKRPEWAFLLQGPGKGITMQDGTLVFPAQYQDSLANGRLPHATIVSSRDHGRTWTIGTGAFPDTTEAQVVELRPGELMLNARYNRKPRRVVTTTRDMGRTWSEHPTSRGALIEPGACMASVIDVDRELGREYAGRLLFSNPNRLRGRSHITIKSSTDGGETWSAGELLDADRSAGYSCLSMIDASTVGILYEGSRAHMTFQRIPLKRLFPDEAE